MRRSEWQIVWDPLGENPRVLLDFDDDMPDEITRSIEQLVSTGRFDFARSGRPASRKNLRRRLSFSRVDGHSSAAASWHACCTELAAAPWGLKSILSIRPRSGVTRFNAAALLSSSHRPDSSGPLPESIHDHVFRVSPVSSLVLPGGIIVIGGAFNSPSGYVVPPLPPGVSLPPGTVVEVSGTPGMPDGSYIVGGVGLPAGGSGEVELEPEEPGDPVTNISVPFITGNRHPDATLTAHPGVWINAESIVGTWWFNGVPTGNTTTSYNIPSGAQDGDQIFYQEIAQGPGGPAGANSLILVVDELPFINLTPPSISGSAEPGALLSATFGTWQSEDSFEGEWWYNGAPTGSLLPAWNFPTDAAFGDYAFYRETAKKAGFPDLNATSNQITIGGYPNDVVLNFSMSGGNAKNYGWRTIFGANLLMTRVEIADVPVSVFEEMESGYSHGPGGRASCICYRGTAADPSQAAFTYPGETWDGQTYLVTSEGGWTWIGGGPTSMSQILYGFTYGILFVTGGYDPYYDFRDASGMNFNTPPNLFTSDPAVYDNTITFA